MSVEVRSGRPQTVTCAQGMELVHQSTRGYRRINSDKTASEISTNRGNKWCNGGLKDPIKKKTYYNGNLNFSAVGPNAQEAANA